MKRFTIIKNTFSDFDVILDVFKSLVGKNVEVEIEDEYYILNYHYEDIIDIENMLLSLTDELMINITAYISSYENIDEELLIALDVVKSLSTGVYNFKTSLLSATVKNKQRVLDFILKSSGVDEAFIKGFVQCDLNVSRASKTMYIHRNTINYKLDKLVENSNFDLRKFIDAYIIYSLIK